MSKYPGYNENDTHWDEYHRSRGEMTNREFFTSNGPGGFYEGMEWDEDKQEWVPNAAERQKQWAREREEEKNTCSWCGHSNQNCIC